MRHPRRPALPFALLALAALAGATASCRTAPRTAAAAPQPAPEWELENPLRPLPAPPLGSPADWSRAPWATPERARLGRWLFYDTRLSADGTVSCGTCHLAEHAFSQPTPVSTGIRDQKGVRKAPPIVNAAFPAKPVFFWDGRAASLPEQARGPILNPIEMGHTPEGAAAAIAAVPGYRPYFREAFGDERIDLERIALAIAAYEATRLSGNSAYDRFQAGDEGALSPAARRGKELFFGRADCSTCHTGATFSDGEFHNLGVGFEPPRGFDPRTGFEDPGRYAVTHATADIGAFKTPTLRDCSKHAPYMHDGSFETLEESVLHYWRGGFANPWLDAKMRPVPMTRDDLAALVAFLKALDGEGYDDDPPRRFPR